MKNHIVSPLVLVGMVALSFSVAAGSEHHGEDKGRFMSFFDTNGDDVVTLDEFNNAARSRFEKMDADNNGVISIEEFQIFISEKREQRREQYFEMMDSDKNGQISQDEYVSFKQKRAERRFQGMDSNGDGLLSKEEFDAGKSRWWGHKHGYGDKGGIFAKLDSNHDGQLTREESLAAWSNWFKRIDANGDHVVTADEVRDYRNRKMESWK